MTTTADLISETRRHLESLQQPSLNKLAAGVTSTGTTLTFRYDVSQIQPGTLLDVDLEVMYVWSVEASSKTVTVERASQGSVAAAHAENTVVTLNPKFPTFAILKAINDDLLDLSSPVHGLYAVKTVQLTATTNSWGYDLAGATDLLEILDVRMKHPGVPRDWSTVTNYQLDRSVSSTDYPSGLSLTLAEGTRAGQPIRVLYKASFTPLANLTDNVETVAKLPASMHDLPPLGATVRLVGPREIRRNFVEEQGDSRRASEVPPGAIGASARNVQALRQSRIQAEASRLAQQFPDRGFMPVQSYGW